MVRLGKNVGISTNVSLITAAAAAIPNVQTLREVELAHVNQGTGLLMVKRVVRLGELVVPMLMKRKVQHRLGIVTVLVTLGILGMLIVVVAIQKSAIATTVVVIRNLPVMK